MPSTHLEAVTTCLSWAPSPSPSSGKMKKKKRDGSEGGGGGDLIALDTARPSTVEVSQINLKDPFC